MNKEYKNIDDNKKIIFNPMIQPKCIIEQLDIKPPLQNLLPIINQKSIIEQLNIKPPLQDIMPLLSKSRIINQVSYRSPVQNPLPIISQKSIAEQLNIKSPLQDVLPLIDTNNITNKLQLNNTTQKTNLLPIVNSLNTLGYALNKIAKTQMSIITPELIESFTNPMTKILKQFTEINNSIVKKIADTYNNDFFKSLTETIDKIRQNPNSIFNWMEYYDKLNDFFWIMPYQMEPEQLQEILKNVTSEKECDKYISNYFNKKRVNSMIDEIKINLKNKQDIKLFNQIINSYNNKDYALSSVGILSIIDNCLSYYLIDKGCSSRINIFEPIIDKIDNEQGVSVPLIITMMISNTTNRLYESIEFNQKITIKTNKKARRNSSAHGKYYSNKKIDSIMLLNTLYYLLIIKNQLNKFKSTLKYNKNQKKFSIATREEKKQIKETIKNRIEINSTSNQ